MGIPGLLKEIGKGERIALTKLAIDHFEKHKRPLRVAIDAAIWNFQHQSAHGGKNPALRTLFFRLLKLLALPIHPVFVYDGKNKPLTKRGKTVSRYGTCVPNEMSKNLVARFQFPHHTAPGEAEAECAYLQKMGVVDAVMSQDVDAIMFGSRLTFRDWSKEGTKGNKTPTHVSVFDSRKIKESVQLDADGMVLIALLSGGDYAEGIPGFGIHVACAVAKAGFGSELIELVDRADEVGLQEWRERLQYELDTNESGYFAKRHKTLKIPDDFPDRQILNYYVNPAVSSEEVLGTLEQRWRKWWAKDIDLGALRQYCAMTFDWLYKGGAKQFIRKMAQPLFHHRLLRQEVDRSLIDELEISERRTHFTSDGIPELRLIAVPMNIVQLDMEAEEENPEFAELDSEGDEDLEEGLPSSTQEALEEPSSPTKKRKRPPWDPCQPEKWWIPEAILRSGMSDRVDEWHSKQKEIMSDPKKFATRKCPKKAAPKKKVIDADQAGIAEFFGQTKAKNLPEWRDNLLQVKKVVEVQNETFDKLEQAFNKHSNNLMDLSSSSQPQSATGAVSPKSVASETDPIAILSPNITQRGRRRADKIAQTENGEDDLILLEVKPALPPIKRFFGANSTTVTPPDHVGALAESECIAVPTSHRKTKPLERKRIVAIPRSSLPGTWKEIDSLVGENSRRSIIDLTAD